MKNEGATSDPTREELKRNQRGHRLPIQEDKNLNAKTLKQTRKQQP